MLPADTVARLAAAGQALSDPLRVQMVNLLSQRPDFCTCEFEALLGLGQSKISYHLKILLDAGIVSREVYGTWSHYRLCDRAVLERLAALAS